jgi:hypothetical protein
MGKASSSKKVARAARTGGSARASRNVNWGFPAAMIGIVVAGILLVGFVRQDAVSEASTPPRIGKDHWHAAYGIYTCDTFAAPLGDIGEDALGIHTHTDGLIHIHPFSSNAAGNQAQLGVFADQVGLVFDDDSFTLPTGETFTTGDDCGGEEGVVRVIKWPSGDYTAEPEIIDSNFADIQFTADGEAFTIFFGPESALDDPRALLPPSLASINDVSDLEPGEEAPNFSVPEDLARPTTTLADGATTTVPDGATTTVPDGASSTTDAAPTPTTAG